MQTINSNKLGLALGLTGVILYLACMCLMLIAGQDGTIWFFNSILHGLDVSSISRMNVLFGQTIIGLILTFGLGWITGFLIGTFYNWKRS
ncbi:MAG: DUF5676 family membrane protein [Saprospiraceae bacterium]|jgi:hypothetical protein|nr:DUF5676 family membrane protein [Saprospiraceae bacterium]